MSVKTPYVLSHLGPPWKSVAKRFPNLKSKRDHEARLAVREHELRRQAYRYLIHNESVPQMVRYQAQFALRSLFPRNSQPTRVKERCLESGRGRGIFTEFGLCRYQFKLKALQGKLSGVEKASW